MGRGMSSAGYLGKKIGSGVKRAGQGDQDAPMRILICSNLCPPHVMGGAEMVAYRHAKVLQEWGQDVRIFCGRFGDAATQPYQIDIEKGEFFVTRVSLSPRDLSGGRWHYDNHQITRAFAKTVDQFSPSVVHFRNLVGLSVKMIDECHRRGILTVMTLHDH
jgi:Glycosyltransferase Family 4